MKDPRIGFRPLTGATVFAQQDDHAHGFVVAAMFTANSQSHAERLKASLDAVGLNYALYQVPSVHRSISPRGGSDVAYSKPNFIRSVLDGTKRPVLYVDADMVFRDFPARIVDIAAADADFAIYNWLADPVTDAYAPVRVPYDGQETTNRFYQFSHSVDLFDPGQLFCSGAVQFYQSSPGAELLLSAWLDAIAKHPGVEDDQLLDYAFNRLVHGGGIKAAWLEKEYCRYAWWIYARPVIDHPEFPTPGDPARGFSIAIGHDRIDRSRTRPMPPSPPFPRNALIDLEAKKLLEIPPPERWDATGLEGKVWR